MGNFLDSLTETRLENMIRFAFHFNRLMGSKVEDMDATYILEKWHSYFGNSKPPVITTDFVDSFIKTKWCDRWSNFELVAGHIQLIQSLQKKMTPLLIIEMFDGIEWDDTHDFSYNGLHPKIRQVMHEWEHSHDDEMKTILRQIRINDIVDK
jgi:hypothetical protein